MIVAEDDHLRVTNRNKTDNKEAKVEAPFKISIHIYIYAHYVQPRIQITHPRPFPPLNNSFKTETCVMCLTNKSNVLFTNCNHICICSSCNSRGEILDYTIQYNTIILFNIKGLRPIILYRYTNIK